MKNFSTDFVGTDRIFLELERQVLPGDEIECVACGDICKGTYWKFGMIDVTKRSNHVCDNCHTALTA